MSPLLERPNRSLLWAVLVGGVVMSLALGTRHVQGLFLLPLTADRGWSRESFSFAMGVQNMVWGLAQPFAGALADRFGTHKVVMVGVLIYAVGLAIMATATHPVVFVLGAGLLIGVALACTTFGVVYGAVSRIAPLQLRASSQALTGALGGVGLFLLVPATQQLQVSLGWPGALLLMAAAIATLVFTAMALKDTGTGSGPAAPQQSFRDAIREAGTHRGFWLLNLGFLTCGFQLAFIASHLPAYLLDKGLQPQHAVAALAIVGIANVVGTYVCAQLGGVYRRKHVLALLYLARTAAMALFLLLPLTPLSLYAFCALMGFMWLGTVPLTNGIVAGIFGVRYISTLFGMVFFGHQLGGFAGAWLGGWAFDTFGSYDPVWIGAMVLGVVAGALHLLIDDRPAVRVPRPTLAV